MTRRSRSRRPLYDEGDYRRRVEISRPDSYSSEPYRSHFRRDLARVIHSPSFRRLAGKTQLIPNGESDFYRNRLTHSLEVAQIAKSIAIKLNASDNYFSQENIDLDLVELAALAHDLGHPPFGHNGEDALDNLLRDKGGYEGNAQTFRILGCLEKRQTSNATGGGVQEPCKDGRDLRIGLNLTARSMAAVLKYDNSIGVDEHQRKRSAQPVDRPVKGYYFEDSHIVNWVKDCVAPDLENKFKTIECSIMDVADDIAYSTYDLEDGFKAGFISPLSIIASPDVLKESIARDVLKKIKEHYPDAASEEANFGIRDLNECLLRVFDGLLDTTDLERSLDGSRSIPMEKFIAVTAARTYVASEDLCADGYRRSQFTSDLVGTFIRAVEVVPCELPKFTQVRLSLQAFKIVEVLKNISYRNLVMSQRIKINDFRGKNIIEKIYQALDNAEGYMLLPSDWKRLYESFSNAPSMRARVVSDYIAGMTDKYCVELYGRLVDKDGQSIHKPI